MSRHPKPNPTANSQSGNDAKSGNATDHGIANGNSGAENSNSKLADATAGWSEPVSTIADTIANAYTEPVSAFTADTADTGTVSTADSPARKRGRPRGSTNKAASGDITGIEKLLLSCHKMLAASIPEMDMDADEAHQIAVAYNDVANYYPIMRLPGNVSALVTFAGVVGVSYGSRIAAVRFRVMAERGHPASRKASQGSPMPPNEMPEQFRRSQPEQQVNGVDYSAERKDVPSELRRAVIAGVGEVEFPPDHPLVSGKRH